MTQLVILGRDGVINQVVDGGVLSPEQFQPIPNSLEAIARLNHAGIPVAVASNQQALADNCLSIEQLNGIHAHLQQLLSRVGGHIDGLFVCPHANSEHCGCRKPATGMLTEIASRFGVSLDQAVMIGDDPGDIEAARQSGATPVLVRTGHGAQTLDGPVSSTETLFVADDLAHAVEHLLQS